MSLFIVLGVFFVLAHASEFSIAVLHSQPDYNPALGPARMPISFHGGEEDL
jgi:hypothetical protein